MFLRNPHYEPFWKASDIGKPMPDSRHAVSVALPTLQSVVDYEEGRLSLEIGYPRFVYHELVKKLGGVFRTAGSGDAVGLFPSEAAAKRCAAFIEYNAKIAETRGGLWAVTAPQEYEVGLKAFWQHTGLIVSSRRAGDILENRPEADGAEAKRAIKERLAALSDMDAGDVFLYPTGMAGLFHVHQTLTARAPGKKTIQLGFPYVDTIRIQQRFGVESEYIKYEGPADLKALETALKEGQVSAIFCEVPGNPLLRTINLLKLRALADEYKVPLVIDDTIGMSCNVDLRDYADIIVTSLTKSFSGAGDVMAGAVTLNKTSLFYNEFSQLFRHSYEDNLYGADAIALEKNSRDVAERIKIMNSNGLALAEFFNRHAAVEQVYHPSLTDREAYDAIRTEGGGYGGLLSVVLKEPGISPQFNAAALLPTLAKTAAFYDGLRFSKGPSLGYDFTMACLYALLAHFHELKTVARQGIAPRIIRISAGTEKKDDLIERADRALHRLTR